MAMMDDKSFLISHIRNSFITSDDTSMCEAIIECDDCPEKQTSPVGNEKRPTTWHGQRPIEESDENDGVFADTELSSSYDILPDMDFASHRRRSNTAQRLEKLKREKHKQSKIKHITWKELAFPVDEIGEYFVKKEKVPSAPEKKNRTSLLSQQLEKCASAPKNPFVEYVKFNGKASVGVATKKIEIFLTMVPPEERAYPLSVVTISSAKIYDVIGLICWQYIMEGRKPPLVNSVDAYGLHIAEDDGEVDEDFPALDYREPISKFGFKRLALVQKDITDISSKSSIQVTVHMPNRGSTQFTVEKDSILMKEILESVLTRRNVKRISGLNYKLEKQKEPGVVVDLDLPLHSLDTKEFCLVRENSVRGDVDAVDVFDHQMSEMAESLSSHQYKSYIVNLSHKLRTNTEVQLGVSGEKIEIDPVSAKGKIFKQKAVTHDTDDVASCHLVANKNSAGKSTLRLVFRTGHDFKHSDFECDHQMAKEIIHKVNNILELRSSPVRKEYVAYKEKKLAKKYPLPL